MSESDEQKALMQWCAIESRSLPELALLFHVPNGGKRSAREGLKFKQMGVKPGVFDLMLPVARKGFHGLFIELKAKGGKVSDSQKKFQSAMINQGFLSVIAEGWVHASEILKSYLEQPKAI